MKKISVEINLYEEGYHPSQRKPLFRIYKYAGIESFKDITKNEIIDLIDKTSKNMIEEIKNEKTTQDDQSILG